MRKRLREWPQRVISYACWLPGSHRQTAKRLPDVIFNTAMSMQNLWNACAVEFSKVLERTANMEKESRNEELKKFEQFIAEECKKFTEIPADSRAAVVDRFRMSVMRYFKNLKNKKSGKFLGDIKPPEVRNGVPRNFSIVFSSRLGGFEKDRIFDPGFRCNMGQVPDWVYGLTYNPKRRATVVDGAFTIKATETINGKRIDVVNETISLRVHATRQLPKDALIKRICLVGKLVRPFGWKMFLQITVEVPPESIIEHPKTKRTAAIDVGWRHIGDYLRIAVIADSDGNTFEVRLPDDFTPPQTKKFITRIKGGNEYPSSLAGIQKMQSIQDGIIESTKSRIMEMYNDIPDELKPDKKSWHLVRLQGLVRLHKSIAAFYSKTEDSLLIFEVFKDFFERYDFWARKIRAAQLRMSQSRIETYRRVADFLSKNYDTIIWEGDLSLKRIAEQDTSEYALIEAAKYRQFASVSDLRLKILSSVAKHGRKIVPHETRGTSRSCSLCGGEIIPHAKLYVECANGHKHDQDINSAKFMLGDVVTNIGRIDIPDILKKYIVRFD